MMRFLATIAVKLYQYCFRPFVGNCCRFYPSCSDYALEALKMHGFCSGCWLAVRRLGKCHPWHPGGVDEVPQKTK